MKSLSEILSEVESHGMVNEDYDRMKSVAIELAKALERVESRSKISQVRDFFYGDPILDYCNDTLSRAKEIIGSD